MPLPQPCPDLVSLDLLRSVADLGSIRRAAAAHRISQPAASNRLRSLEAVVGLDLLDRSSGRAQLTPSGRAVVEWAARVVESMEALVEGAAALRSEATGELLVAASMTVAEYLVPQWLIRLRASDRELRVSLTMGNSDQVIELVREGRAEVGFVEGLAGLAGLGGQVVHEDELVVVVDPSHPWAARSRRPVSAAELATTPLVLREPGSGTREVLESALRDRGLTARTVMELSSTTAIKNAVASGLGPAVLSRLALRAEIGDGRLVAIPVEGVDLSRSLRAVWRRGQPRTRSARRLLRLATETRPTAPVS